MSPHHRHRLAILTAILSIQTSSGFTSPSVFSAAPSSTLSHTAPPQLLRAVASPLRPIEDEQEKEESSIGRLLPKFFKRRQKLDHSQDSLIKTIDTLSEYKQEVANSPTLTIVRFYATWCKSCKASYPQFKQLAMKYPEVKFVQVPLTKETAYIHEGLGVPSVPYAHLYHPEAGLVEEMKVNKRSFGEFGEVVGWYVRGECELSESEEKEEEDVGFQ